MSKELKKCECYQRYKPGISIEVDSFNPLVCAKCKGIIFTRRKENDMKLKQCQLCGSDAKLMKESNTHCNCSNKDCLLYGDRYFHIDKWNKRKEVSTPTKENILEVLMDSNFYKKVGLYYSPEDFSMDVKKLVNDLHALLTSKESVNYDIIEDLRLDVIACLDSRDQNYIDDLFKKAMNNLKTSRKVEEPQLPENWKCSRHGEAWSFNDKYPAVCRECQEAFCANKMKSDKIKAWQDAQD